MGHCAARTGGEPYLLVGGMVYGTVGLFPSIVMALYGLGWLVAAAMSEAMWLRAVSIASFIAAVLIALAADSAACFLATAAALYLLMALPGWMLTRSEPSDVV